MGSLTGHSLSTFTRTVYNAGLTTDMTARALNTEDTCDRLSLKTLMDCERASKRASQHLFLLVAEAEQPAPTKTEEDNTAKSTVEMEGKIQFVCF